MADENERILAFVNKIISIKDLKSSGRLIINRLKNYNNFLLNFIILLKLRFYIYLLLILCYYFKSNNNLLMVNLLSDIFIFIILLIFI